MYWPFVSKIVIKCVASDCYIETVSSELQAC